MDISNSTCLNSHYDDSIFYLLKVRNPKSHPTCLFLITYGHLSENLVGPTFKVDPESNLLTTSTDTTLISAAWTTELKNFIGIVLVSWAI